MDGVLFWLSLSNSHQWYAISSPFLYRLSVAKEVVPSPSAAGGRCSEGAACAAVDEGRRRFVAKDIRRAPQTEDGLLYWDYFIKRVQQEN